MSTEQNAPCRCQDGVLSTTDGVDVLPRDGVTISPYTQTLDRVHTIYLQSLRLSSPNCCESTSQCSVANQRRASHCVADDRPHNDYLRIAPPSSTNEHSRLTSAQKYFGRVPKVKPAGDWGELVLSSIKPSLCMSATPRPPSTLEQNTPSLRFDPRLQ